MEAVLSGPEAVSPEMQEHLRQMRRRVRAKWHRLRQTMALLDEWQAPEPSPYFGSRLRAQMREEAAAERARLAGLAAPSRWWLRPRSC